MCGTNGSDPARVGCADPLGRKCGLPGIPDGVASCLSPKRHWGGQDRTVRPSGSVRAEGQKPLLRQLCWCGRRRWAEHQHSDSPAVTRGLNQAYRCKKASTPCRCLMYHGHSTGHTCRGRAKGLSDRICRSSPSSSHPAQYHLDMGSELQALIPEAPSKWPTRA